MIDLNEIARQNYENVKARGKKADDVLETLKYAGGELVEATEAWARYNSTDDPFDDAFFRFEVSDVIMCMLTIACSQGWNIEDDLYECLQKNLHKQH